MLKKTLANIAFGSVSLERDSLRIPFFGVRPRTSPKNFHKTDESSHFLFKKTGSVPGHLSRRPFDHGPFEGKIKDGAGYNHVSVPSSRIDDQFEEVRLGPDSVDRVLGRHGGQRGALLFTAREENSEIGTKEWVQEV